jgi:hypothetical protein
MNEKARLAFDRYRDQVRWKEKEFNIIKKHYKKCSDQEISERFFKNKRSRRQVQAMRHKLRLLKTMQPHQIWTSKEIEILKNNYKKYNQRELQEKFFPDKTIEQVRSAKMSRNLHRDPVWTVEEVELLLTYGSTMSRKNLQRLHLPNKTVDQISWTKKYYGVKAYQVHHKK